MVRWLTDTITKFLGLAQLLVSFSAAISCYFRYISYHDAAAASAS
jgi:hypothetical protein